MGRVENKVAFVTGAARGQGRSHAVRLASEGADIIAIDIAKKVESNVSIPATPEDLAETVRQVEALDRRIVATEVDVRDYDALKAAVDAGVAQLGRLDIVCANAGVWSHGTIAELAESDWQDAIDVLLTGVWHTCKASVPILIEQGTGGSIVLTSSAVGLKGAQNIGHYVAAKHGVVGLMRSLALELGTHMIRVNTVNPGGCNTGFVHNPATYRLFAPDIEDASLEVISERFQSMNAMPVPWVEPIDISNAVLYLASDEARYVTGITLPVDAGNLLI